MIDFLSPTERLSHTLKHNGILDDPDVHDDDAVCIKCKKRWSAQNWLGGIFKECPAGCIESQMYTMKDLRLLWNTMDRLPCKTGVMFE